jgi:hypothetical protein
VKSHLGDWDQPRDVINKIALTTRNINKLLGENWHKMLDQLVSQLDVSFF